MRDVLYIDLTKKISYIRDRGGICLRSGWEEQVLPFNSLKRN